MELIGVIGAGAWGTALAAVAARSGARAGRKIVLWAHEADVARTINARHENPDFLPGVPLEPTIRATTDLGDAAAAPLLLLVVPAVHLRGVATALARVCRPGVPLVICAKGVERGTGALVTEVIAEVVPAARACVLSGPSFAAEAARDKPTAVTFAATDADLRAIVPAALSTPTFRIYASDDPVGAALGGAVKNVLAIAAGIVEGRDLGDNARAALITRGLAEMMRLAIACGGRAETMMGLAGLGDLVLTCNALQSRNFSLGVALGRGDRLAGVLAARGGVTEGVFSAEAVMARAKAAAVDMPIVRAVDAVLNRGADIDLTIADLLARPLTREAPTSP